MNSYKPLPAEAARVCAQASAPPRLLAHLVLVHHAASTLIEQLDSAFPGLSLDRDAILFGAATHDIGKAARTKELIEPGENHEKAGFELLRQVGVSEERARFAYTHGNWKTAENISLDDLIVALADKIWKGKRNDDLEARVVEILSRVTGKPQWDCYAALDEILDSLAPGADEHLAWQRSFSAAL